MPRSVTLGLALSIMTTQACALVEPPVPPPGTVMVELQVRNSSDEPVGELGVKIPGGMLPNAARPPSVPAESTTNVTFYVPTDGDWWIALNGVGVLEGEGLRLRGGQECTVSIEFTSGGGALWERHAPGGRCP